MTGAVRARKICSWRDPANPARGCSAIAVSAPGGDDFRCAEHQREGFGKGKQRRAVPPLTQAQKDWVWERDWGVCRKCGEEAAEVDHVVEVADGGDNRPDNLQLLCQLHHDEKTRLSQEAWKEPDVRRGTSARAKAKRRTRQRGLYQQ